MFRVVILIEPLVLSLLVVGGLTGLLYLDGIIPGWMFASSAVPLAALGVAGGVLGSMMSFGCVRWRCPFCGNNAEVGADREHGFWMACECGFHRKRNRFRWNVVRTAWSELRQCPSCGYDISRTAAGDDQRIVCSECGSKWLIEHERNGSV